MKLYKITLRGFLASDYRVSFALANNADAAYKKVRAFLDEKDLGFAKDRALESAELVAEGGDYPECGVRLFQ